MACVVILSDACTAKLKNNRLRMASIPFFCIKTLIKKTDMQCVKVRIMGTLHKKLLPKNITTSDDNDSS